MTISDPPLVPRRLEIEDDGKVDGSLLRRSTGERHGRWRLKRSRKTLEKLEKEEWAEEVGRETGKTKMKYLYRFPPCIPWRNFLLN